MFRKFLLVLCVAPLLMGFTGGDSSTSSKAPKHEQYFSRGQAALEKQEYDDAVKWYKKALRKKENYPDALNGLAFSMRMIAAGHIKQAEDLYNQALTIDPEHVGALEYQGELWVWKGELVKANDNLEKLKQLGAEEADELAEMLDKVLSEAKQLQ